MRKFHRHGYHRFGGRPKALSSAIWLIGIGVLMLTGDWWPGILVLVGLSMVVEAVFKDMSFIRLHTGKRKGFPGAFLNLAFTVSTPIRIINIAPLVYPDWALSADWGMTW